MIYKIQTTNIFDRWLRDIKDRTVVNRIMSRIYRMEHGNVGDAKTVGKNLFEMRFFFGPGFRLYYTIRDNTVVLLLCGGNKLTQEKDIEKAKNILEELK